VCEDTLYESVGPFLPLNPWADGRVEIVVVLVEEGKDLADSHGADAEEETEGAGVAGGRPGRDDGG